MKTWIWITILFTSTLSQGAQTATKATIATYEVPPFISEKMPGHGAGAYAMKKIFKDMGYDLEIRILPVRRALAEALRNPSIDGFTPASKADDLNGLVLSKPIYQTRTLLIQRPDHPIDWEKPEVLAKFRGGNVRGYPLRGAIKELHDKKKMQLEESPDDVLNLIKLAEKRVDYVLIADGMYHFLMQTHPKLKPYQGKIQPHPKPLMEMEWAFAFKPKEAKSAQLHRDFDAQVRPEVLQKYINEYLKNLEAGSTPK